MKLLDRANFKDLLREIEKIPFNTLFAETVLKGEVDGMVYCDDEKNPEVFYIVHPYRMGLLYGNNSNMKFNEAFRFYGMNSNKQRDKADFVQVYPFAWEETLNKLFEGDISTDFNKEDGKIKKASRVNFLFDRDRYKSFKNSDPELKIEKTGQDEFLCFKGAVTPLKFFRDSKDFLKRGVGFTLKSDSEALSTAFSSFITEDKIELGMETVIKARGKGFALLTCSKLIDYCLEKGYEPVWACMLENKASYRLALKLGFTEENRYPYYILPA